jgi:hypothetical protein
MEPLRTPLVEVARGVWLRAAYVHSAELEELEGEPPTPPGPGAQPPSEISRTSPRRWPT